MSCGHTEIHHWRSQESAPGIRVKAYRMLEHHGETGVAQDRLGGSFAHPDHNLRQGGVYGVRVWLWVYLNNYPEATSANPETVPKRYEEGIGHDFDDTVKTQDRQFRLSNGSDIFNIS